MQRGLREFNRVTLEERLVHRYLLERYYLSDIKTQRRLLPKKLRKFKLNLIVPEPKNRETSHGRTRPDLELYFKSKGTSKGKTIPVEAKWDANDLKKSAQKKSLQKGGGFCAALNPPHVSNQVKGIEYVQIPYGDFKRWFLERAPLLLDETIQQKVGQNVSDQQPGHWIIPLRGTSVVNFDKVMDRYPKKPFWAFQNRPYPLSQVFRMKKGDKCLFLRMKGKSGQIRLPPPDQKGMTKFQVDAWYEGKISQPYHMRLDDWFGNFFEKKWKPIAKRRWPHFISMHFDERNPEFNGHVFVPRMLASSLTYAVNHFYAPCAFPAQEYEVLLQKLRHEKEMR